MDTYPALLLPSWAFAIEAVGHATSARVDDLVDSFLGAPQQTRPAPTLNASPFPATRESFLEFVEGRGPWAQRAFACLLQGTRPRRGRESFAAECDWAVEDTRVFGHSREREADDLIELVQGLDAILVMLAEPELLSEYRWRHLGCGFHRRGFALMLRGLLAPATRARLESELVPIVGTQRSCS